MNAAHGSSTYPAWQGWAWASALSATAYLQCLMHHKLFWCCTPFSIYVLEGYQGSFTIYRNIICVLHASVCWDLSTPVIARMDIAGLACAWAMQCGSKPLRFATQRS